MNTNVSAVTAALRRERDITELRDKVLAGSTGQRQPMDETYFATLRDGITGQINRETNPDRKPDK